jgi:hypothetical protein
MDPPQQAELDEPLGRARAALGARWDELERQGRELTVEQVMQETERTQEERVHSGG